MSLQKTLRFGVLLTTALLISTSQLNAQPVCSLTSIDVWNTTTLNQAIGCVNAAATARNFEIRFIADIYLTKAPLEFSNLKFVKPNVTIRGNGHLIDGRGLYRILVFRRVGNVRIENLTIAHGTTGIFLDASGFTGVVTVADSRIQDNGTPTANGGGVENYGMMDIFNTVINRNRGREGGGIFHYAGMLWITGGSINDNYGEWGGGIHTRNPVTLVNVTMDGNRATRSGGAIYATWAAKVSIAHSAISGNTASYEGGGIYINSVHRGLAACLACITTLSLTNSTVSGNEAGDFGGGLYFLNNSLGTLKHVTIANNDAGYMAGGVYIGSDLHLVNSILADNFHGNCMLEDVFGSLTVEGVNIVEAGDCDIDSFPGQLTGDPRLGALALNAPGTTQTHALLAGSIAIDASPYKGVDFDQRYAPRRARPSINSVDTGAYEAP